MNNDDLIKTEDASIKLDITQESLNYRLRKLGIKITRIGMQWYMPKKYIRFVEAFEEISVHKKKTYDKCVVSYFNKNSNKTVDVIASELKISPGALAWNLDRYANEVKQDRLAVYEVYNSKMNFEDFT